MGRRPIVQPNAPRGIDPRTRVRFSIPEEQEAARRALQDLERERLVVVLVPAPDPHFSGHMIRVVECRNPEWYREFIRTLPQSFDTGHRHRIVRALERIVKGRVKSNGYEERLLKFLDEWATELV